MINLEKYPAYQQFLSKAEPTILNIIDFNRKAALKDNRKFTKYDEEYIRIMLTYKIVNTLATYLQPNDEIHIDSLHTEDYKIVIGSTVTRNNEKFYLDTTSIHAGGYNIQQLHARYLIKTNLPKDKFQPIIDELKTARKKLTKTQKINEEISYYEKLIVKTQSELEILIPLTQEQILEKTDIHTYSFHPERYSGENLPGNVHKDQETFNEFVNDIKTNYINQHNRNISFNKSSIFRFEKSLTKLKIKLSKI